MSTWLRTWRQGNAEESKRIVHALHKLAGGTSVIDLGCRSALMTKDLQGAQFMDVDPQADTPATSVQADILTAPEYYLARKQTFDLLVMTDVIEHLERGSALRLLSGMAHICKHSVIFTPIGELWLTDAPGPHSHRSGWTPEEFYWEEWQIWEWPTFHRFADGNIHGAFWAWRGRWTPQEVAATAGVDL